MRENVTRRRKLTNHTAPTRTTSPTASSTIGLIVVGLIVAGVAALLQTRGQGPAPFAMPSAAPPTPPAALSGFRADAWFLPDDDLLGFVEIAAGPFTMGADKTTDPLAFDNERWSSTQAQGVFELPSFYIGRYEVTVAQFQAFASATARVLDAQLQQQPASHPVAWVTWPDALAYCRWLEAEMVASPRTPPALRQRLQDGWHVTLPSEAQWEKAARGSDARRYPWGAEPRRDRAVIGVPGTEPVGSRPCPECAFGLADLSGNVWEWTRSPYQAYPFDERDDTQTASADAIWVMRGGAFNDTEQNARATTRGGADPGVRRPFIGFRVALSSR